MSAARVSVQAGTETVPAQRSAEVWRANPIPFSRVL